jgi:hypothetical protein
MPVTSQRITTPAAARRNSMRVGIGYAGQRAHPPDHPVRCRLSLDEAIPPLRVARRILEELPDLEHGRTTDCGLLDDARRPGARSATAKAIGQRERGRRRGDADLGRESSLEPIESGDACPRSPTAPGGASVPCGHSHRGEHDAPPADSTRSPSSSLPRPRPVWRAPPRSRPRGRGGRPALKHPVIDQVAEQRRTGKLQGGFEVFGPTRLPVPLELLDVDPARQVPGHTDPFATRMEPRRAISPPTARRISQSAVRSDPRAAPSRTSGQKRAATCARICSPGCSSSHANTDRAVAPVGTRRGTPSSSSVSGPNRRTRSTRTSVG